MALHSSEARAYCAENAAPPMPAAEYQRYIVITDTTTDITQGDEQPGADIDAIGIRRFDTGRVDWVTSVEFQNGNDIVGPPSHATGSPSAFPADEVARGTLQTCRDDGADGGFVSLGGGGQQLGFAFVDAIRPGDTVWIVEIGLCETPNGLAQEAEHIQVHIMTPTSDLLTPATWLKIYEGSQGANTLIPVPGP